LLQPAAQLLVIRLGLAERRACGLHVLAQRRSAGFKLSPQLLIADLGMP